MPPGSYLDLRMSADGREVLLPRGQRGNGTYDLWRLDLRRGVDERLTSEPGNEISGLWVPGRPAIVYARWVWVTSFDRPVVPEVGISTAGASDDGRSAGTSPARWNSAATSR